MRGGFPRAASVILAWGFVGLFAGRAVSAGRDSIGRAIDQIAYREAAERRAFGLAQAVQHRGHAGIGGRYRPSVAPDAIDHFFQADVRRVARQEQSALAVLGGVFDDDPAALEPPQHLDHHLFVHGEFG